MLTRPLKFGTVGKDVESAKRAVARRLGGDRLATLASRPTAVRRTFGPFFVTDVKAAQRSFQIPQTGVIGPALEDELHTAGCFDLYAIRLAEQYAEEQEPKLVEPSQGFDALDSSLWKAFSLGRQRGFSDLGVYNPSAANKAINSDHAVYPSLAFDLGIDPDTGWNHLKARAYVLQVVGWREVEYVILGDRIYHGRSWRSWTRGGHLNHIHVSGVR